MLLNVKEEADELFGHKSIFEESDDFDEDIFETISTTYIVGSPSDIMSHTIRRKPEKINAEPPVVDKPEFEFYE